MSRRILYFGSPASLSTKDEQLKIVIHETGEIHSVPISDLAAIELDSMQISITTYCLAKLAESGVTVSVSGANHCPAGIMLPVQGNERQTEVMIKQVAVKAPMKKQLWKQIVGAKIYNQARMLEINGYDSISLMKKLDKVQSGDTTNQEGSAAVIYWKTIFGNKDFRRDPDGENPNNLLNYGYAVIRAIAARAIVSAGLNPALGLFHRGPRNPFCLADDLMEPYRPYADSIALMLYRDDPEELILNKEQKSHLLKLPFQEVTIAGEQKTILNAMQDTVASLVNSYFGGSKRLALPIL